MTINQHYLLGKDHPDPTKYQVQSLDQSAAISIASVVTVKQKSHNLANNEDASGIYRDEKKTIMMVADAHWGYNASHEAVLRFPNCLEKNSTQADSLKIAFEQVYLNAIMELSLDLQKSRPRSSERITPDGASASNTQFHSFVQVGQEYYWVGMGDCYSAVIRDDSIEVLTSKNSHITLGSLIPNIFMRPDRNAAGLELTAVMDYDNPLVRNGIDVRKLDLHQNDIFFMCSDGFKINDSTIKKRFNLPQLFKEKAVPDVLDYLLDTIIKERLSRDNVTFAAMRIK